MPSKDLLIIMFITPVSRAGAIDLNQRVGIYCASQPLGARLDTENNAGANIGYFTCISSQIQVIQVNGHLKNICNV